MAEPEDSPVGDDRPSESISLTKSEEGPTPRRLDRLVGDAVEAEYETGRREETEAEAKRHLLVRIARIAAGVIVLILGIIMLAAPGPGLLVIALGLGLLAQDVPFAARLLAMVRRRLPQEEDGSLPTSMIVMMVVVGVAAVAGSIGFWIYRMNA
jgi:uncharacterized protein (TIGR02611 family)